MVVRLFLLICNVGDSVEIVDVEGDQQCSVLAFDSKKSSVLDSLSWTTNPNNDSSKVSIDGCSEMLRGNP